MGIWKKGYSPIEVYTEIISNEKGVKNFYDNRKKLKDVILYSVKKKFNMYKYLKEYEKTKNRIIYNNLKEAIL
jgi:hypothetical protein